MHLAERFYIQKRISKSDPTRIVTLEIVQNSQVHPASCTVG